MIRPACFGLALALALAPLLAGCPSSVGGDGPSSPALDAEKSALLYELNAIREKAGIATPMITCNSLLVSSAAHSDDMRNNGYLSDVAPDGSTVRTRTCAAGYKPGCSSTTLMAQLVASGIDEGAPTADAWAASDGGAPVMLNAGLVVAGTGHSLSSDGTTYWTLDLGGENDPSCTAPLP
jgi:uncharacterized protein YkwD